MRSERLNTDVVSLQFNTDVVRVSSLESEVWGMAMGMGMGYGLGLEREV